MLIQAVGIKKSYSSRGKKVEVLKGIDFELKEGEFVSIMGPSGVGKSTFLHILGLLDEPDEGRLLVEGKEAPREEGKRALLRNRTIGFVFQYHYLLPEFTALENAALPCLISGMDKEEAFHKAKEILTLVGLENRLYHRPSELSGGELQRVALARALAKGPKVVIADEPTGNLDKATSRLVAELMLEISSNERVAFVIATHDEDLAALANRVYLMRDGLIWPREVQHAGS